MYICRYLVYLFTYFALNVTRWSKDGILCFKDLTQLYTYNYNCIVWFCDVIIVEKTSINTAVSFLRKGAIVVGQNK